MALYGWGWTKFGQLSTQPIGSKGSESLSEPTKLPSLEGFCISKISSGLAHSAIISGSDDEVFAFGKTADGRLGRGIPTTPIGHVAPILWGLHGNIRVTQVSCGGGHSSVIDSIGRVFCFGKNESGQLGNGTISEPVCIPSLVDALLGLKATLVACGARHTLVAVEGMNVYGFGANESGQLGTGVSSPTEPSPVAAEPTYFRKNIPSADFPQLGPCAVSLAAGNAHSAVAFAGTTVFCWGSNSNGQCGCCNSSCGKDACIFCPTPVCGPLAGKAALSVSCGHSHTAAVGVNGVVYTWGDNKHFQCAQGTSLVPEPAVVRSGALEHALCTGVSCGAYHTVAIGAAGDVYAWGLNDYGQVQGSEAQNVRVPYHIRGPLRDIRISDVSCGGRHTLALCAPLPAISVPKIESATDFGNLLPDIKGECLGGDVTVILDSDGTKMVLHKIFLIRSPILSKAIKDAGNEDGVHINGSIDRLGFRAALDFLYGQEVQSVNSLALVAETLRLNELLVLVSAEMSQRLLVQHLIACLNDEKTCDVTLIAGDGYKISAHKVILAARSRVFERMFYGYFCESVQRGEVTIPNCSGSGLKTLVRYIYSDYDDKNSCAIVEKEEDALDLLEIADMHGLSGLKTICEKYLSEGINIENVALLYDISMWYNAKQLGSICEQFIIDNFAEVIESEAFKEGISDAMRDNILLKTTRFSLLSIAPPMSSSFTSLSSSSSSSPPLSSSSSTGSSPQNPSSWVGGCSVQ